MRSGDSVISNVFRPRYKVPPQVVSQVAELMTEWSATVSELVEESERCRPRSDAVGWADELTGPVDWAFDTLKEALSPEAREAVGPVLYWSSAGLLHQVLQKIDPTGRLVRALTAELEAGGYVPFVVTHREES